MGFFKFIDTIGSGIANGAKTVAKGTVSLGKGLGETAESGVLITRSGIAAIGGDSKEASRLSKKAGSKIKSGGIGIASGAAGVVGGAVDGTLGSVVNGGVDVVGEIVRPIDADAANTIESPAVKAGVNIAVGIAVTVATAGGGGASLAEDAEALAKIAESGGELAGEASDLIATTKKAEDAERLVQEAKDAESLAAKALKEGEEAGAADLEELEQNASDASKAVEEAEDSASEANTMKDAAEEKINNSDKWEKWKNVAKKIFKTGNTLNTLERAKLLLCLASPTLPPLFTSSKYKNDADFRDMLSQLGGFIFTTSADGTFIVPSVKDETYTLKGTSEKGSTSIEFEDTDSLLKDMVVSGDGIDNGTRVSRVNEFTVDLNKPTVEKVDNNIKFYSVVSKKVSAGKDSPLLTLNDTKDLQKYMQIIGDGIPKGSRIMSIIDGKKVMIGKGKLPTLSQSKTTKQLTNSGVQFRALVKQNMPDPTLDAGRIMSSLAWYDNITNELQREVKKPDQSILDKATVANYVPDRLFAMGDIITPSGDGESTTFTINVVNTQTGEKTPWSPPPEFAFGYYLFKSERDCLSSASDKALLKKANKIHEGKTHDVFNSKTRKTLKLIGMILLAILVLKMVSKSKTHPILKTAITLSIIAGVVFYHTPIQTMINRISSHKLAAAQQRVSSVKDKLSTKCDEHTCVGNTVKKSGVGNIACFPAGIVSTNLQNCSFACCEPPLCSFACVAPRIAISGARGTTDSECCKNPGKPSGRPVQIKAFYRNPGDIQGAYMLAENDEEFEKIQVGDIIRDSTGRLFGPTGKVSYRYSQREIEGERVVVNVVFLEGRRLASKLTQWPENLPYDSGPYTVFVTTLKGNSPSN